MFRKRSRPQPRARIPSLEPDEAEAQEEELEEGDDQLA
jgi:hypothetical protein